MVRITLSDVLKKKIPNTDAMKKTASKRRVTKEYADEGKRRQREMSKAQESQAMLNKGRRSGNADKEVDMKSTKGGVYPVYEKKTETAQHFRDAFASARKEGKKEFTWNGKKYNTKVK